MRDADARKVPEHEPADRERGRQRGPHHHRPSPQHPRPPGPVGCARVAGARVRAVGRARAGVAYRRGAGLELPEPAAIAVFRIFQEMLSNVGRHAQASRLDIRIEADVSTLRIAVRDNGVGAPARGLRGRHRLRRARHARARAPLRRAHRDRERARRSAAPSIWRCRCDETRRPPRADRRRPPHRARRAEAGAGRPVERRARDAWSWPRRRPAPRCWNAWPRSVARTASTWCCSTSRCRTAMAWTCCRPCANTGRAAGADAQHLSREAVRGALHQAGRGRLPQQERRSGRHGGRGAQGRGRRQVRLGRHGRSAGQPLSAMQRRLGAGGAVAPRAPGVPPAHGRASVGEIGARLGWRPTP